MMHLWLYDAVINWEIKKEVEPRSHLFIGAGFDSHKSE